MSGTCNGGADEVMLVCGSPQASSAALVAALASRADAVVAVDRGIDYLHAAGVAPQLFCGDCDTASPEALAWLRAAEAAGACDTVCYDPYKDDTDLSLALSAIAERWPDASVTVTCASGGRPDHALAVLGALARAPFPIALEEDIAPSPFAARIVRAGEAWELRDRPDAGFSFIPLAPGTVVSEDGMEWELDHHPCELLGDLGVSNVIRCSRARFTVHAGCAVAYVFS